MSVHMKVMGSFLASVGSTILLGAVWALFSGEGYQAFLSGMLIAVLCFLGVILVLADAEASRRSEELNATILKWIEAAGSVPRKDSIMHSMCTVDSNDGCMGDPEATSILSVVPRMESRSPAFKMGGHRA